jgi:CTP-dependent riboflavin kinase
MILTGEVVRGCGHFKERMTTYREVFKQATGEHLHPGTINVNVGEAIEFQGEFRIKSFKPTDLLRAGGDQEENRR